MLFTLFFCVYFGELWLAKKVVFEVVFAQTAVLKIPLSPVTNQNTELILLHFHLF